MKKKTKTTTGAADMRREWRKELGALRREISKGERWRLGVWRDAERKIRRLNDKLKQDHAAVNRAAQKECAGIDRRRLSLEKRIEILNGRLS